MSQKKRVNDLAKEVGITGKELVEKLRSWGFDIKSAMAALEEFQELQIRGMMEARGLAKVSAGAEVREEEVSGGLILKKKKKKKLDGDAETGGDAPGHAVAEETPEPEPQRAHAAHASASEADVLEPTTERHTLDAQARSQAAHVPAAQTVPQHAPREHVTREHVTRDAGTTAGHAAAAHAAEVELTFEAVTAETQPVENAPPERAVEIPRPLEAAASSRTVEHALAADAPALESEAPAGPTSPMLPPSEALKPLRMGKVVGFIDLSKIKSQPAKKPIESRRLRSKDDVAPDVRPTLGSDKKKALVRGDHGARGKLTAAELRDREAGRFLRRNATGGGPGGGGGRGGGRGRREDGPQSPYSGQEIKVDAPVTVKKLADKLSVKSGDLLKVASRQLGFGAVNINSLLDEDTATLLANEFQVELKIVQAVEAEDALIASITKTRTDIGEERLVRRPPTVAFLGHVDHGKTTLIDTIRSSRVAAGESGGITQHIGAYQVMTKAGHALTIIDTPGHAAFTQMRARGARAVDIVVLVVAADDGPMPSTEEALAHARSAKVPVVVALTKIDKADADVSKAMQSLTKLELVPEEWGGETAMIPVSALKNQGVEELLERVFLETEVLELRCHPEGPAKGVVLEAEISEGKGIVAHLLVQDGTLKRGDVILAGEGWGKVRAMFDDRGRPAKEAPPSMPIEVTGLSTLPGVGEFFYVVQDVSQAKEVAEERERKNRALSLTERRTVTAESLMRAVAESRKQNINLIVRADVQGSVEVLKSALSELKHEEVEVKVLFAGVGTVTENDVNLAGTSNAMVIAFHVGTNDKARIAAERQSVEIRYYEVLYELLDHLRALMEGVLSPELSEEVTGHVEVRTMFKSSKVGTIAGCNVTDGTITKDSKIRVLRDGKVIHSGLLASLRREKEDVKEVRAGFDCGIVVKDFQNLQPGDILEAHKVVKTKRTLGV